MQKRPSESAIMLENLDGTRENIFPDWHLELYLKLQFTTRGKVQQDYIDYFLNAPEIPHPHVVHLDTTLNRCNSTCEFWTA